jgi:hypothetical protein
MHVDLYAQAKQLIQPGMGKQKLANLLGIKTPSARRLIERFRGETQGHSSDPVYRQVQRLKTEHPQWGPWRISQALGITPDKAKLWLARYQGASQHLAPPSGPQNKANAPDQTRVPGGELRDCVEDDSRDVTYLGTRVRTLEDLLVNAEVDRKTWEVARFVVNKWEIGAKNPATGEILTSPLWQVKAWLRKRLLETRVADVLSSMLTAFKNAAPERPALRRKASAKGLLEISILDLHMGKFCSAPETGAAYNVDLARQLFWEALNDLLAKAAALNPERILFPVGNDFFNTDNGRTTTRGTPVDEAVRWQESFVAGRQLIVEAIERLLEVAPVHVPVISGNHDCQRCFYLGDALGCWFSKSGDVAIDNSPAQRKYYHWGKVLLGYTHGCEEPHVNLPLIMAQEQPTAWAGSVHREWHVGHWHLRRKKFFLPVEDQNGIVVRIIPSLCPPDAWHKSRGYQSKRAAEAFYWDAQQGCVAEFTHAA